MTTDANKGPEILGIFITLSTIATILVALRLWVRLWLIRKTGLDDWVVLVSLILLFGSISCMGSAVHYGLGRHYDTLDTHSKIMAVKMVWVGFQITPSAEAAAKISITIMLMRVTNSKRWKYFFIILIVLTIFITVASLYSLLLSCHPIQLLWDPSRHGACDTNERTVDIYIQGVMAAAYDVILATSPIIMFWNVQVDFKSKMLLCGLLGLGFFTCAAGIARTAYTPDTTNTTDPTWAVVNFVTWKCVELPLSLIVGCLPTLRPLYHETASMISRRSERLTEESHEFSSSKTNVIHKTTQVFVRSQSKTSEDSSVGKKTTWATVSEV